MCYRCSALSYIHRPGDRPAARCADRRRHRAPAHLYEDQISGKREDRPGLTACLKALRPGDTLVVWKLDRRGRHLRHLINTVHELTGRGIGLKVLAGHGAAIDTATPAGKLVFGIFATLSEFERDLVAERTVAGLASARARARGRQGGRPYKMTTAKLRLAMAAMGKPRNYGRGVVPRTRNHPSDVVPARVAERETASRWSEAAFKNQPLLVGFFRL
jgi:DNA invertase Pin-like site-specific DNA recombinase